MTSNLTTARRSTRAYNNCSDTQRQDWMHNLEIILRADGMSNEDASDAACMGDWDGMDTPSMAAKSILRGRAAA